MTVQLWAERIWTARRDGVLLDPPSLSAGGLDLVAAYAVQEELHRRRLARGERAAGWKLGYTSAAMRTQMGIAEPNSGPLTDAMILRSSEGVPAQLPDDVRHPRVEPEVALVLGSDLVGEASVEDVRSVVVEARAALEVVDSTWRDYRFTLADNTADGSSAAYVVLGEVIPLDAVDDLAVQLTVGEVVSEATTAAAMGSPWTALAWLRDHLADRGLQAPAGSVVITGGLTAAVAVPVGDGAVSRFGEVASVALIR